jgi:hypothetical protein
VPNGVAAFQADRTEQIVVIGRRRAGGSIRFGVPETDLPQFIARHSRTLPKPWLRSPDHPTGPWSYEFNVVREMHCEAVGESK